MKQKVRAGAELDFLTPDEARDELNRLRRELREQDLAELAQVRRIPGPTAEAAADGTVQIRIGSPGASFMWDVRSIVVSPSNPLVPIPGNAFVFKNEISAYSLMDLTDPERTNPIPAVSVWTKNTFVVGPNEAIIIAFTGLTVGQRVAAAVQVVELPSRSMKVDA